MNLNKTMLIGRITSDLELKTTTSGKTVVAFGFATNRSWKNDKGEKQDKTDWHNIVAWDKQAEVLAQYCEKGQEMYFEGRGETRSWEDDKGEKKYRHEVVVEKFEFGNKPQNKPEQQPKQPQKVGNTEVDYPSDEVDPDDIPF